MANKGIDTKKINASVEQLTKGLNGCFGGLNSLLKKEIANLSPEDAREAEAMMRKFDVKGKIQQIKSDLNKLRK